MHIRRLEAGVAALVQGREGDRNGWVGWECKNRFGGLQGCGLEGGDWCAVVWVDGLMGCARARGPRRGMVGRWDCGIAVFRLGNGLCDDET